MNPAMSSREREDAEVKAGGRGRGKKWAQAGKESATEAQGVTKERGRAQAGRKKTKRAKVGKDGRHSCETGDLP
jgi:hypothetical protein